MGLSSWELHASFIEQGVAAERDEGPQRRLNVFHIKLEGAAESKEKREREIEFRALKIALAIFFS